MWTLLSSSLNPMGQNVQGITMKVYLAVQWKHTSVAGPSPEAVCPFFCDKMWLSLFLKNPRHGQRWCCVSTECFGELDCCPNTLSSFNEGGGRKQDQICNALSQKKKKWQQGFVKCCVFLHQSSRMEEGGEGCPGITGWQHSRTKCNQESRPWIHAAVWQLVL